MENLLEPCAACARFIRSRERACPFCGTPHETSTATPSRSGLRSRLAVIAGAALLAGACGGGDGADGAGDGSSGGEVVHGEGGGSGELGDGEQSCAGVCGDHHHPACMDEDPPCEAPPYGTPPIGDLIV